MSPDAALDVDLLLPPGVELSASKRRLFEAALLLFGRNGYHAVSIRDIANALGQQPSAIYFHVLSKQQLLSDLTHMGHKAHYEALRNALMDAGADSSDQLAAVVGAHLRQHLDYPSLARVTNRELQALTPDQLQSVMAIRAQSEQIFIDVIERGIRQGAFDSSDSFLVAKAIGAMGIRLPEWWSPASHRTREQIIDRYTQYALKLLAPSSAPGGVRIPT
ncbi:MAG: TetR/AcrR family transcriptional regulator [Actinomycetota bacterium]|nr:TetR/AcrR family transcriptional regulator [Actinomycetota bacterium]